MDFQFELGSCPNLRVQRRAVKLRRDLELTDATNVGEMSCSYRSPSVVRSTAFCSLGLTVPSYDRHRRRRGISEEDGERPAISSHTAQPYGAVVPSASGLLLRRHGFVPGGWNSGSTYAHLQQSVATLAAAGILVVVQGYHTCSDAAVSNTIRLTRGAARCVGEGQLLTAQSLKEKADSISTRRAQEEKQARHGIAKATVLKLLAGGLAGAVSKSAVAPLERLTTIMMADVSGHGFRRSFMHMWRDGGLIGLWSGNAATLAKIFPQTAIQFAAFHSLKEVLSIRTRQGEHGRELNNIELLLVGSIAGLLACSATYPLDTMRTQMSITGGLKGSLFSVGSQIIQKQGVAGLYKGFAATLTSDVLGSGLGFMNYEIGTKVYREWNDGRMPSAPEKGVLGALSATATLTIISECPPTDGRPAPWPHEAPFLLRPQLLPQHSWFA